MFPRKGVASRECVVGRERAHREGREKERESDRETEEGKESQRERRGRETGKWRDVDLHTCMRSKTVESGPGAPHCTMSFCFLVVSASPSRISGQGEEAQAKASDQREAKEDTAVGR